MTALCILCLPERVSHAKRAIHRQQIRADTIVRNAKQRACCRIDVDDMQPRIEQDQSLMQIGSDVRKFVCTSLQLPHLRVDLSVLSRNACEKRGQFRVGLVFERVSKVQTVERLHDPARQSAAKHKRQHKRRRENRKKRREHSEKQCSDRRLTLRNAQHCPIRQAARVVHCFF